MAPRAFGVCRPSPRGRRCYGKNFTTSYELPGDVPEGGVPEGGVPEGGLPPGPDPPGGVPDGGVPFISIPAGGVPAGRVPFACMPSGGVPKGAVRLPGTAATVTAACTEEAVAVSCTIAGETDTLPVPSGVLPVESCVHPADAIATARMITTVMMKMRSDLMDVPSFPS